MHGNRPYLGGLWGGVTPPLSAPRHARPKLCQRGKVTCWPIFVRTPCRRQILAILFPCIHFFKHISAPGSRCTNDPVWRGHSCPRPCVCSAATLDCATQLSSATAARLPISQLPTTCTLLACYRPRPPHLFPLQRNICRQNRERQATPQDRLINRHTPILPASDSH